MKKIIVFAVVVVLFAGLTLPCVSASLWKPNYFGSINAEMINDTTIIGGQPISDEEIQQKIANLFAEPMLTPTPEPTPVVVDWLGCP